MKRRPWTKTDEIRLGQYWMRDDTLAEIAQRLDRHPTSVSHKARFLGLPRRRHGNPKCHKKGQKITPPRTLIDAFLRRPI